MALDQHALLDLLGELKLTDVPDRIRQATERLYQGLIEAEATAFIGAGPFERSAERTTQRNGSRPRTLSRTVWINSSQIGTVVEYVAWHEFDPILWLELTLTSGTVHYSRVGPVAATVLEAATKRAVEDLLPT